MFPEDDNLDQWGLFFTIVMVVAIIVVGGLGLLTL